MTRWEVLHCPYCGCVLARATEGYTLDHPTSVACLGDLLGDPAIVLRCSSCGRSASWWLCLPEESVRPGEVADEPVLP